MAPTDEAPAYGPGYAIHEMERLKVQARLIEPITRRWFVEAGIGPGMRVLDVGSGVGDVALLAAHLVGATGQVVGTDRSTTPLVIASQRASDESLDNVHFHEGDPTEMTFDEPFDAVVGRYVLMYQPNPVAMVRQLASLLRPGGIVAFHEPFRDGIRSSSFPSMPTYDRGWQLVDDAFRGSGADPLMGIKLHATFVAAGLPSPTMRMESVIGGGTDCLDNIHFEVDPLRTMLPVIEHFGLATASDVSIDTYVDRVRDELRETKGVIVGRAEVGAWSCAI